jgi:hypothetical protein
LPGEQVRVKILDCFADLDEAGTNGVEDQAVGEGPRSRCA